MGNCSATAHTGQKLETTLTLETFLNYKCWQISLISVCHLDRKYKTHIGKKVMTENLCQALLQLAATHLLYRERDSHWQDGKCTGGD